MMKKWKFFSAQKERTNPMTSKIIEFNQFKKENVSGSKPVLQSIKKPNETINYNEVKLSYNYGTPTNPITRDLYFELPKMRATGVKTKEEPATGKNGPYTKVSCSMMLIFDLADPETKDECLQAVEKLDEVHHAACLAIDACKGQLKMYDFDPQKPGGMFKNPVFWHRDEVTGEKVKGKNPSLWVKLYNSPYKRTLFTGLDGKAIDWKLLNNVEIEMVPLLHIEKIYVGAKLSLQIHLASAVVLKVAAAGSESLQVSTMEKYKTKYGGAGIDQLEAQLADLRMNRQDALDNTQSSDLSGEHPNDKGTMEQLPQPTSDTQVALQDFLAGAPPMQSAQNTSLPSLAQGNQTQTQAPPVRLRIN